MSLIPKYNSLVSLLGAAIQHLEKEKAAFSQAADQIDKFPRDVDEQKSTIKEQSQAKISTIEVQIKLLSQLKRLVSSDLDSLKSCIANGQFLTGCATDVFESSESQGHREKLFNYLSVYFFIIQGSNIDFGLPFFAKLSEVDSFDKLAMIYSLRQDFVVLLYPAIFFTLIFFVASSGALPVVATMSLILASFSALLSLTCYLCSLTSLNSIAKEAKKSKLESNCYSSDVKILHLTSKQPINSIITKLEEVKSTELRSGEQSDEVMSKMMETASSSEDEDIAKAITYVAKRIKNTELSTFHNGEPPHPLVSFELPRPIMSLRSGHKDFFSSGGTHFFFENFELGSVIRARQLASHLTEFIMKQDQSEFSRI